MYILYRQPISPQLALRSLLPHPHTESKTIGMCQITASDRALAHRPGAPIDLRSQAEGSAYRLSRDGQGTALIRTQRIRLDDRISLATLFPTGKPGPCASSPESPCSQGCSNPSCVEVRHQVTQPYTTGGRGVSRRHKRSLSSSSSSSDCNTTPPHASQHQNLFWAHHHRTRCNAAAGNKLAMPPRQ
jgi:hypothetical protein